MQIAAQTGVGHDQPAAVEDVVAGEAIEEALHVLPDVDGRGLELGEGAIEAVGNREVRAGQLPTQLQLVVAGHAEGGAGFRHPPRSLERVDDPRPAVDQIAEENDLPRLGTGPQARDVTDVAEASEQFVELVFAAVHVTDDVERARIGRALAA